MKRVIIVHCWGGKPEDGWYPWLKSTLEEKGYEVIVPIMPDTGHPTINKWVEHLKKQVETPDENTHFVGHSIGCQTILRYLEQLPKNLDVGKVVLVAGWFTLTEQTYEDEEQRNIATPWIETPINFENILQHTKEITAILSDNDPYVPLEENKKKFSEHLKAKIIIEHNKGHISKEEKIMQLTSVLKEFEQVSFH